MTIESSLNEDQEETIISIGNTVEQVENRKKFYKILNFIRESGKKILENNQYNSNF